MGYLTRQLLLAGLTANAVRPLSGFRAGALAFPAGWLTGELAPELLAAQAADTAISLARGRASKAGLLVAGATAAGLGWLTWQSRAVRQQLDQDLEDGLGPALAAEVRQAGESLPERAVKVAITPNVQYAGSGLRGRLDIYRAERPDDDTADASDGRPVLLQVHGGGWTLGRKHQQALPLIRRMAADGWIVVDINYRLAPKYPWPQQIIDVKRAIAWVRENIADYGGDPDYLAITGGSAGGHLAALAALTPGDPQFQPGFEDADTSVQVAVPHYGVYDLAGATGSPAAISMRDRFLATRVMLRSFDDDQELFESASPLLRITEDAPDFYVVHGAGDSLVVVDQARSFVQRLREQTRARVVYSELPYAQHAFDTFPSIRSRFVVAAVERFLHWHHASSRPSPAERSPHPGEELSDAELPDEQTGGSGASAMSGSRE